MTEKAMNISEIRREGLKALQEKLGLSGMFRFLNLYDSGNGDYTQDRRAWADAETVDSIAERVSKRRGETQGNP